MTLPKTRYQGSKTKLLEAIGKTLDNIPDTKCVLDLFGGTGIVSLFLKTKGYNVIYNDIMKFNASVANTLLNTTVLPSDEEVRMLFVRQDRIQYKNTIETCFHNIYFTDDENKQLDIVIQNINSILQDQTKHIMMYLLVQSCISKRPYNLFHRKNLEMRLKVVERSFGNLKTWNTTFIDHMLKFKKELATSVLDIGSRSEVVNEPYDCISRDIIDKVDTVYIDPPYFKSNKSNNDYILYYHFLEGLTHYDIWETLIDETSLNRKFKLDIESKYKLNDAKQMFLTIINMFSDKNIVISYRSDGFPPIDYIMTELRKVKTEVHLEKINYKYALSKNTVDECIIVAKN
jgi:adenine-specific DNA-methyltransferase